MRHLQQLIFNEWMERTEPLPRFTGPDGSAAIFVVKSSRRKEWLKKLFGSVSEELMQVSRPLTISDILGFSCVFKVFPCFSRGFVSKP